MTELRLAMKDEVSAELGRIRSRIAHPEKLMKGIAAELLSITEDNFAKESSDGAKWQKLAAKTIAARKKKGHWPGKMLQISAGGLAASVKPFSSVEEAGIGVSKVYAAIQQLGGKAGRGKKTTIPARPYLPMKPAGDNFELSNEARSAISDLMADFIGG
jgi:phage virion morphogenesis protein